LQPARVGLLSGHLGPDRPGGFRCLDRQPGEVCEVPQVRTASRHPAT